MVCEHFTLPAKVWFEDICHLGKDDSADMFWNIYIIVLIDFMLCGVEMIPAGHQAAYC